MTDPDEGLFDRAVARILLLMIWFAAAGALAALIYRGWTWGVGFLLGSAVSWFNFRWLKQIVEALGGKRPRASLALIIGSRYLILAGGAYVILKYTVVSLPAALVGLFVSVAAVLVEIILELAHARN